jgi:hypothetical protein
MMRAQTVVELYLSLALVMVLMLFLVTAESVSLSSSIELLREAQGRVAVKKIADAVGAAFIEGGGSEKIVYVSIPPNFNPKLSYIGNGTSSGYIINLRLDYPNGAIDVQERTQVLVKGSFGNISGLALFTVKMSSAYPLAEVTRPLIMSSLSSVQVVLEPGENQTVNLDIPYYGESTERILVYADITGGAAPWIYTNRRRAVSNYESNTVDLLFAIPDTAIPGVYHASMSIRERAENGTLKLDVPIHIVVTRAYEWMRLEPMVRNINFNNTTNYAEQYTTNFVLCNDHTDAKTLNLGTELGDIIFMLNETPQNFNTYTWNGAPLLNYSGFWFNSSDFRNSERFPFLGLTTKGFSQPETIQGGMCSSFRFKIWMNPDTATNLLRHIRETTNNSSIRIINFPFLVSASSGGNSNVAVFNVTMKEV